jgi:ribulose-phosphate 3-epimerase
MRPLIAPSILAADFANLQKEVEMINESEADWIHVDVMDGVFVPNISFGLPVTEAIKRHARKPLDVHLMIVNPDKFIEGFFKAGASVITVHYEACTHLHRTIQLIKSFGCKAGVAINPHTSPFLLEEIIHDIDLVLIMSVNPGYGGQQFIRNSLKKVKIMKEIITDNDSQALIEIDGGVNRETGLELLNAGADVLVAGSSVFSTLDPVAEIKELKNLI